MKIRERVVHVPVVVGGGGVGAMFGAIATVIAIGVLIAVAVERTHPAPHYQPPTSCAFCTPTTAAATTPPAEYPLGGER